jgi:hypothetical protein
MVCGIHCGLLQLEYMMDHHRSDYKHTLRATDGLVGHDHGDLSLVAGGITGTPHVR